MAALIGVFGGTFDPPHLGHLILADEARAALNLSTVLWAIVGEPPHKPARPISSVEHRLEMVSAAIGDVSGFQLSRVDVDRPGPHYTVDSLRRLRQEHPGGGFAYLMGSDSLADFPTWRDPAAILHAVEALAVMRRPGSDPDLDRLESALPGIKDKVQYFEAPFIGISGQEIRRRAKAGLPYRFLVPRQVFALIESKGLYR